MLNASLGGRRNHHSPPQDAECFAGGANDGSFVVHALIFSHLIPSSELAGFSLSRFYHNVHREKVIADRRKLNWYIRCFDLFLKDFSKFGFWL